MADWIPDEVRAPSADLMPGVLERFKADRGSIERRHPAPLPGRRYERLKAFLSGWRAEMEELPFETMARGDQTDWLLLKRLLGRDIARLDRAMANAKEAARLVPSAATLIGLEEDRRDHLEVDPAAAADVLDRARRQIADDRERFEKQLDAGAATDVEPALAHRAAKLTDDVREMLGNWHKFHSGYNPAFNWWCETPYKALDTALTEYAEFLRKRLAGTENEDAIVGDPIGRDGLMEELEHELISHAPEELIEIGQHEFDWCRAEMTRAAGEMGCADWREALERVKGEHCPPGEQPALVRDLAVEAIAFLEEHDLVTVPDLARDGWRMEMMAAERQKVSPFFLGGETIVVSFPTNEMDHGFKLMSARGNNRAFSRATVQHELIPGHYLQAFSQERYHPYRRMFYTPFWVEGWALHWEMVLWDAGFPRTPEERIGMLFWRSHRCARVLFSLKFHLGEMSPEECVAILTDDVGHELENARGEVRRSLEGGYGPLYQCAYLIGGLQIRALQRELVDPGRMSIREFHDAIMRENAMPIAILRALLSGTPLTRDFDASWDFA